MPARDHRRRYALYHSDMDGVEWRQRAAVESFGPASITARVLAMLAAVFVRPVLAILTAIGVVINCLNPDMLQRMRLDVIDKPLRVVRPLPGTQVIPIALPHCPAEWVVAPRARDSDRVVIYFHGSALVTLGLNSHRRFVSKLSEVTGARVFNVGYRLAPRVVIEEAASDGLDAYVHVLSLGFLPNRIVLAGDSAGGLIATNAALAARDAGLPVPAGQALMSPLASSDLAAKQRVLKTRRDPLFPFITVKFIHDVFATVNGTRPSPPTPLEADLFGLGPFLLQVGTDEMLLEDTFALAERLRADNVPVWVQLWDRAVHAFQLSFDVNPDARQALDEVGSFIRYLTRMHDEISA
jgi:epsilon-lactone hydrolase